MSKSLAISHTLCMEEQDRWHVERGRWPFLLGFCLRNFPPASHRTKFAGFAALIAGFILGISPLQAEGKTWRAGNYSFSDELGGFTIRSVAGTGTRENPIVIEEELHSASPVTMTVRAAGAALDPGGQWTAQQGNLVTSALFLRIVVINGSGQSWIEFEFELQEILHRASVFGDGLSFDQRRENSERITSSAFQHFSRDFEPYDRLRFIEGKVDPRETADFEFALTDFTPRWQFFLVQDPRIPSS